jgi:hypothetical protein
MRKWGFEYPNPPPFCRLGVRVRGRPLRVRIRDMVRFGVLMSS